MSVTEDNGARSTEILVSNIGLSVETKVTGLLFTTCHYISIHGPSGSVFEPKGEVTSQGSRVVVPFRTPVRNMGCESIIFN